jgi:Kef-type K+ transport system membrane component KefB
MNARGLMELILLNIGLQQGLISQTLFTMLVLMAIVTTLMSSPLFELFYGQQARKEGLVATVRATDTIGGVAENALEASEMQ